MKKKTMTKHTLTLLTALLLASHTALHAVDAPLAKPQSAPAPESEQVKLALPALRSAAEYSRSAHGVSVLVMQRGEIIFEDYAPGWKDRPHELASGTKSFAGVMAVCAVQDGLLTLDEKVSDTVTEWKADPRKSQVTIRQLLSLSSGIEGGENGAPPMYRRAIVLAEATADPGTRFSYGPIPFQCFGELMRRKLEPRKESVEAYLKRRILDPIGLQVGTWAKDREGNLRMPSGASLTAREWAKFGELIRLGGKWQGKEIVPEALLKECFKPSTAKPNYGLTFWLLGRGTEGIEAGDGVQLPAKARRVIEERKRLGFQPPKDTVAAMGKGKQRCYVIPSQELVIIRLGDSVGQEFSDNVFLSKLLGPSVSTAGEPLSK
jgi:CubicO group peptidase (beta-lactamase class C family)